MRHAFLPVLLLTLAAVPASAEEAPPRVRIKVAPKAYVVGRLVATETGFAIQPRQGPAHKLAASDVADLEYSKGRRHRAVGFLRGAGFGLVAGVAAGAGLGFLSRDDSPNPDCWFFCSRQDKAMVGAYLFGIGGTAFGGAVGALLPSERWKRSGAELRLGLAPASGGVRAALDLRF